MSFLITAYGRSGTKFLSSLMNRSEVWTVLHEPRGNADAGSHPAGALLPNHNARVLQSVPDRVQQAFQQENYGEVNSYLRYWFPDLELPKKGVILRDVREIAVSVANRHELTNLMVADIARCCRHLRVWSRAPGVLGIDFAKMTSDPAYTQGILMHFGIDDVVVTEEDVSTPVNVGSKHRFQRFEDLPGWVRRRLT